MDNQEVLLVLEQLIPIYFNEEYKASATSSTNEIKQKLIPIIEYLLDHDFERLLNILYRIDVDESAI